MDLFSHANQGVPTEGQPLAEKLRPRSIDEMLGQPKILGKNSPWRKLIDKGELPSLLLWGPPGTGKTTFALLLAQKVDAEFVMVNAVETGAKALRELGEEGRRRRLEHRRRTLVFVDEIHRLNKSQQDVLLPSVEKGDIVLVGATTENPSYEINSALISRTRILVFERLGRDELLLLLDRAAATENLKATDLLDPVALEQLLEFADGDGRRTLNFVETILSVHRAQAGSEGLTWPLNSEGLLSILEAPGVRYDKTADEHYDIISAFIKSIRGSDPTAAIYYLARMVKGGEDPVFIARRLVVLASEDVGNADPRALQVAISGLQAVELIGWPEARISLAQVTTYLASAPKSNRSYTALNEAMALVEKTGTVPIPLALRSAKTAPMKNLGYGKGYKYSHEGEKGYLPQRFLPEELGDIQLYEPSDRGFEKTIRQYLEWMKS